MFSHSLIKLCDIFGICLKKKKKVDSFKHTLYWKLHLFLDNERMICISWMEWTVGTGNNSGDFTSAGCQLLAPRFVYVLEEKKLCCFPAPRLPARAPNTQWANWVYGKSPAIKSWCSWLVNSTSGSQAVICTTSSGLTLKLQPQSNSALIFF